MRENLLTHSHCTIGDTVKPKQYLRELPVVQLGEKDGVRIFSNIGNASVAEINLKPAAKTRKSRLDFFRGVKIKELVENKNWNNIEKQIKNVTIKSAGRSFKLDREELMTNLQKLDRL